MPLGPFDPIPPREKIRRSHVNDLRTALTGIQDAYDVAVANGFVGTRGQWLDSLKGEKGDPGAGLAPIGSAETFEDLPSSGNTVGDVRTVDADGRAYRWDGSEWVDVGLFRGPPGDLTQAVADTLYPDKAATEAAIAPLTTPGAEGQLLGISGGVKGWVDPPSGDGLPEGGTAGQAVVINESLEPVYVDGPIHAEAFGVYGDGAAEGAAINSMIDKLNTDADIKTSSVQFRAGKVYTIETPINIYGGVQLLGAGTGNAHADGTFIRPHASFTGAAGVIAPDPGGGFGGNPGWLHQWHIRHLRIEDFPDGAHGFWSEAGIGESCVFDDVWVRHNTGWGALFDGAGIPMWLGRIAAFGNGAGGVHIANPPNLATIEQISGDDNGGPILKISDGDPMANVRVMAIKAESSGDGYHDTVVALEDLQGAHVHIDQLLTYRQSPASTDPIIHQTRTNTSYAAGTFSSGRISGQVGMYGAGYEDDITGISIPGAQLTDGPFDTRQPRFASADLGVVRLPNRVLSETIGTSETRLFHGFDAAPAIEAIIPHGDATVWQSSAPDADCVYLTASASVDADVVLSQTRRQPGLGTLLQADTFTASNGTNIGTSHTPDTGSAWSTSLVWNVYDNKARPGGGYRYMGRDVGTGDVRMTADIHIDTGAGVRAMGLFARSQENGITDAYVLGFYVLSGSSVSTLGLTRNVGGTSYSVAQAAEAFDITVPITVELLIRGRSAIAKADGVVVIEAAVDPPAAGETWCGVYAGARASAAPYQTVDNIEIWG